MTLLNRTMDPAIAGFGMDQDLDTGTIPYSIEIESDLARLEPEWRALESLPQISIHQSFDWCSTWLRHVEHEPLIIVGRIASGPDKGSIAFILPMSVEKAGPVRIARYMGSFLNNLNFGLYSREFLARCNPDTMRAIVRSIRRQVRGVDLLLFDRHPLKWRGLAHPFSHLPQKETSEPTYQVDLTDGFDGVLAQSNRKRRRKRFRTSEKRLNELGGYDYVFATTPEEAGELLRSFFEQKAKRFEKKNISDVFAPTEIRAFLEALAADSIGKDEKTLELHAIRMRDASRTPCAVAALSVKGGHVLCQFSSIATGETESASPGELLFYLMIRKSCDEKAGLFDFGMGDEQFKRSWCNITTRQYYMVVPTTLAGYLASAGFSAIASAKRFVKSRPELNANARKLRERAGRLLQRRP